MAQKRYGPTRGAGVVIIELEGQKSIEPGALGMAGYAGVFEKGDPGELIIITQKNQFLRQMGSYIEGSLAPDACIDYYDAAAGAGGLLLVRVTDGGEVKAQATLYQRKSNILTPMGTVRAKNGGRWGGKEKRYFGTMATPATELTDTTLDTGVGTFKTDQWKGGFLEFDELPNVRFPIVGNDDAGLITVAADQTMLTQYNASGGADLHYHLVLENDGKALSIQVHDGEDNPTTEFGLSVYVDGTFITKYPNLNTDPDSERYWVNIINNDDANVEIEAVDLVVGSHTPATRPANHYGLIDTVTATVLNAVIYDFTINSPVAGGDPTFSLDAVDDEMVAQKITITMSAATTGAAVSDKFGALGTVTLGAAFVPDTKLAPEFTVTAGGTALDSGDTLVVNFKPFKPDSLIGGFVWPDKVNAPNTFFRITDNDIDSITVADGSDMTADGAPGDSFMVSAPLELEGGIDGSSDLLDTHYNQQAWDVSNSPFNRVVGRNLGLIKFATPGVTATAVAKAGAAYCIAKNHQYRHEVPSNITTDQGAIDHINSTVGRTEYSVGAFPSYGYVPDPEATEPGKLKLTTLTGMIHGVEAAFARNYDGYHKAAAGIDAILSKLLSLPTGERVLNEEFLNPAGLQIIKKVKGNFIIWGDRTFHLDPTWRFKHQREQMSYYEHVLQENFDWIIFAINDPATENLARAALRGFFFPEYQKRALRGSTFDDAAVIKLDQENNTDATRANGDMFADIALRLADTVERFIIRIGKQGIFESTG